MSKKFYSCTWCDAPQDEDYPFRAWDWCVCAACFRELESEDKFTDTTKYVSLHTGVFEDE